MHMALKNLTIYDVAEAAGVSVTTVSDVLNERDRVARETVVRVREVIRDIGYRPRRNRRRQINLGQPPASTKTRQVAFLVPDPRLGAAHTYLMEGICDGMRGPFHAADTDLLVTTTRPDGALPLCIERGQVDGAIVRYGGLPQASIERLTALPLVWLFSAVNGDSDLVAPDDETVARLGLGFLAERGCCRVLLVNPDDTHGVFCMRAESFRVAARELGVTVHSLALTGGQSLADAPASLVRAAPDGIFFVGFNELNTPDDAMAFLRQTGVPAAQSGNVVGQSDYALDFPHITIQPSLLGQAVAEQLLWRLDHPHALARRVLIPPQLIVPRVGRL